MEENFYSLSSYRPTHAHITQRVMLLFLKSVTTHNASAATKRVNCQGSPVLYVNVKYVFT